jgi:hypothetical protein
MKEFNAQLGIVVGTRAELAYPTPLSALETFAERFLIYQRMKLHFKHIVRQLTKTSMGAILDI